MASAPSARAKLERTQTVPPSSRLTVRPKRNRRRVGSLWSRLPKPAQIADACGRAVRRSVPALAALAALGVLGGTAWAGYHFVTTSPRFAITDVAVRGNHRLSADDIRAAAHVELGDNVFATNLEALVRGLRANPWVADAEAHRVLPHTIAIEIREREPAAIADLGGLYLVDGSGHPFKRAEIAAGDGADLPVVTGLDRAAYAADPDATARLVQAALATLDTWRANGDRPTIGEVHLDPHGAIALVTFDQATAIQLGVPGPELAARLATFDAVWTELTDAERTRARAIHIDARPDHVTVAFKD